MTPSRCNNIFWIVERDVKYQIIAIIGTTPPLDCIEMYLIGFIQVMEVNTLLTLIGISADFQVLLIA